MSNQPATSHTVTLQQHYQALQDAHADFSLRVKEGVLSGDVTDAKYEISKLRTIAATFQEALQENFTPLSDGKSLLTFEHEALKTFSDNNEIWLDTVLPRVRIENGRVNKVYFYDLGLSTLEGLGALSRLRRLDVSDNQALTSLSGVNTQVLEALIAYNCGLTELSALQSASKLKELYVGGNQELTSLSGVNTHAIEQIGAYDCALKSLSTLHSASKLKVLEVSENQELASLYEVNTQAIETIRAGGCDFKELFALQSASKLRVLCVSRNQELTSLDGVNTQVIEVINAEGCALSDLSPLQSATRLQAVYIRGNPLLLIPPAQQQIAALIDRGVAVMGVS